MRIAAKGSATNINIDIVPKGTGVFRVPTGYEANIASGRDLLNREYLLTIAKTFTAKQSFTQTATTGAINIVPTSGEPSALVNGDIWYDSSLNKFRAYQNGAATDLIGASGASTPFSDAAALVKNAADNTKLAIFSAASITTATTRTYTLPNTNGTLVLAGTTLAHYGITDALSTALTDGRIFVGNVSNVATGVAVSGDFSLTNAGAATVTAIRNKTITLATGFLKYSGSAWTFDNSTFLTANQTITLTGAVTGSGATSIATTLATVAANKGGTGFTSYAVGDILYANTTSTLAKRAAVATGSVLGSAGVGTAPAYLSVTNGLTADTTTVKLGGTLVNNTTIIGAFDLNLGTVANPLVNIGIYADTDSAGTLTIGTASSGVIGSYILIDDNTVGINMASVADFSLGTATGNVNVQAGQDFICNAGTAIAFDSSDFFTVSNNTGTTFSTPSFHIDGSLGSADFLLDGSDITITMPSGGTFLIEAPAIFQVEDSTGGLMQLVGGTLNLSADLNIIASGSLATLANLTVNEDASFAGQFEVIETASFYKAVNLTYNGIYAEEATEGLIQYNATTNKFRANEGGTWKDVIGTGGGWAVTGTTTLTGNCLIDGTGLNIVFGDAGDKVGNFEVHSDSEIHLINESLTLITTSNGPTELYYQEGLGLNGAFQIAGGQGHIYIANLTTAPTSNPTGGGFFYVQGGALKFRGSSGTITTIANP